MKVYRSKFCKKRKEIKTILIHSLFDSSSSLKSKYRCEIIKNNPLTVCKVLPPFQIYTQKTRRFMIASRGYIKCSNIRWWEGRLIYFFFLSMLSGAFLLQQLQSTPLSATYDLFFLECRKNNCKGCKGGKCYLWSSRVSFF